MEKAEAVKIAVDALQNMKSDDLQRAQSAFRHCTEAELDGLYGQSGKTRRQIIQGYKEYNDRMDEAISILSAL